MEHFFAPCPRGLESVLAQELSGLDATEIVPFEGGVGFAGGFAIAARANLWSRLASRVLWRVARGPAASEAELYALAKKQDWGLWFSAERSLRVDVTGKGSPLKSLEFATLKVKDAICDRFRERGGARPNIDKRAAEVRVFAFLEGETCTLYLDTSGEALFKRGYRRHGEDAPLRENLAAGLLALAGWSPGTSLLDPMCGSGTILIEAAQQALDLAPGLGRDFGFRHLSWFDAPTWQGLLAEAEARRKPLAFAGVWGSDISASAISAARVNLDAAGLTPAVRLQAGDVLDSRPPAPSGLLLTNPPYGHRLADETMLAALYPRLGDTLKRHFSGWTAAILTADPKLPKLLGLKPRRRIPLFNGALECRLLVYPLVAGGMRRPFSAGAVGQ